MSLGKESCNTAIVELSLVHKNSLRQQISWNGKISAKCIHRCAFPITHFLDGQTRGVFVESSPLTSSKDSSKLLERLSVRINTSSSELQPSGQILVVDGNRTFRTADGKNS